MVAFVFVHGTGVREARYDDMLTLLREGVGARLPGARIHRCYWGDLADAADETDDAGLTEEPPDDTEDSRADRAAVLWGVLYEDPLACLRQLAGAGEDTGAAFSGTSGDLTLGDRSGPEVERRARALAAAPTPPLAALLGQGGLEDAFRSALAAVLGASVCQQALARAESGARAAEALAYAWVAVLLRDAAHDGRPLLWDTGQRDTAVRLVGEELGLQERGLGLFTLQAHGWAAHRFGVMRAVEKRREVYMERMAPQVGDILRYLVRGDALREVIAGTVARVARTEGPVVLIAHSLGAIASVDLLATAPLTGVRHLVTMGTQVGYLAGHDALPVPRRGQPLPAHFPRWTNVVDRRDLLAFPAEPHFPGRVRDVEITSGEPFPVAHRAYLPNKAVHGLLAAIAREDG